MDHGRSQCLCTPTVLLLKQNRCVYWKGGASCNGGAQSIETLIRIEALTNENKFEGGVAYWRGGAYHMERAKSNYYGKQFQ